MAKETLLSSVSNLESRVQSLIKQINGAATTSQGGKAGQKATFSGGTGGNFLSAGMGTFSSTGGTGGGASMSALGNIAQGAMGVAQGVFSMMPDVGQTMQRAGTYYNATLRAGGGMSRNAMQQATFGALRDGITSPGSDAMVAGHLAQRGMMASASFGSTYQQTLRSVSSSAKYLNMSNERSVAAIEGLTSGSGSSNMLRQFGVFTSDLATGKEKTQGQIFGDLYGRMTAGQGNATEKQTMDSLRRGNLGAMLKNSGMTEDQQAMFSQYAIEKSRGNNMDLSDPAAMESMMKKAEEEGNKNPFLPGYKLNTSKTGAMQSAESAYIAGIELATPALQFMTEAAGNAAGALGALKAAAMLMSGSGVGAGLGAMGSGAGQMIGGGMQMGAGKGSKLGGVTGSAGSPSKSGSYRDPATGKFASAPAPKPNLLGKLGSAAKAVKVPGAVGAALTAAASIPGIVSTAQSGGPVGESVGSAAGSIAGGIAGGIIGQALIPIPGVGFVLGSLAGSMLGGMAGGAIGGALDGAGGDTTGSNGVDSGAPKQLSMIHPINPAKISATFGQKEYGGETLWPNGHNGIDYSASMGQTIFAAADGIVHKVSSAGELGTHVVIKHGSGHYTFYCHLSSTSVSSGPIKQGTPVGGAGKTGRATGVHLHFALSTSASTASCIDPMPYITGAASKDTYSAEQQSEGGTPNSQGDTTGRGQEDTSNSAGSSSGSILTMTKTGYAAANSGGSGMSNASGLKSWGAGNVAGSGAGSAASNGDLPIGGDGYVGPESSDDPLTGGMRGGISTMKRGGRGGSQTNNVTINLTIGKATEEEAKKFTQMLKKELEHQTLMTNMARK